jgi:hypothetical protein
MQINETENILKQLLQTEDALLIGISERKKKLEEVRKQINVLRGNKGFPWTEKALGCINASSQMVNTDEILKWTLVNRKDDLELAHRRKGYITALSVALNKLRKAGRLKEHKVKGVKGLFYGLPEWWEKEELSPYYRILLENKTRSIKNNNA